MSGSGVERGLEVGGVAAVIDVAPCEVGDQGGRVGEALPALLFVENVDPVPFKLVVVEVCEIHFRAPFRERVRRRCLGVRWAMRRLS